MIIKSQILQKRHALERDNLHSRLIFSPQYLPLASHSYCATHFELHFYLFSQIHAVNYIFLSRASHTQKIFNIFPDRGAMEILFSSHNEQILSHISKILAYFFLSLIKPQSWIPFSTEKTSIFLAFESVKKNLAGIFPKDKCPIKVLWDRSHDEGLVTFTWRGWKIHSVDVCVLN